METPHQQVLVRPSPAAASALLDDRRVGSAMGTPTPAEAAAAAAAAGNILCAGCGSIAGDYLQEPDLSACCFRCLRRLPLCSRCVDAASPGGDPDERRVLDEAVCCSLCIRVVCRAPGCSTRCSDRGCEALVCSKCRPSLPECSGCLMPHCEGSGDSPGTGCLSKCRGKPDCKEGICRLCERGRCGCEICGAASCDSCRRECNACGTVSCPECHVLAQVPRFCEGCGADRCMVCAVRMRPCEECGQRVTRERLLEGMSSMTGFIEKWSTFDLPGSTNTTTTTTTSRKAQDQSGATTPELLRRRSLTNRAEIAQRWMTFVSSGYTNGEPALPRAGPGYPVAGAGVGVGAAASAAPAVPSVAELTTSEGGPGGACVADGTAAAAAAAASSARDSRPPVLRALAAGEPPPRGTPAPVLPSPYVKGAAKNAGQGAAAAAAEAAFEEKASGGLAGRGGGGGGGAGVSGAVAAAASAAATPETRGGKMTAGQQQQQQQQQSAAHPSGRLSIDMLREFVATSNETNRFPTGVAEIKAVFHGWVEPAVVDLYYDGSRNIPRTLNQCQKDVEQVAINDHAAAAAAAATRATASPAPSSAGPPTSDGARDWVGYTSTEPGSIGRTYWHNTKDGRTTWEDPYAGDVLRPLLGQQAQAQQQQGAASAVAVATHGGRKGGGAPMTVDEAAAEGRLYISAWKSGGFDIDQYDAWMTRAMAAVKNQADNGGGGAEGAASKELLRLVVTDAGVFRAGWDGFPGGGGGGGAGTGAGAVGASFAPRRAAAAGAVAGVDGVAGGAPPPSYSSPSLKAVTASDRISGSSSTQAVKTEAKGLKVEAAPAAPAPATASAAAASALAKPKPKPRPREELKRSASGKKEAAGASSLEAQMADLQAAEERKQTAKAKKAARRAEEAAMGEERELREAKEREEAAARRKNNAAREAAAAQSKADAARSEAERIAEAKAATEARVMATVAAAARAEREAKEAARRKQKEDADAQEAERARRQERARAVADANAANEARAAERAAREEREQGERATAAAAGAAAGGGAGGGALLADMSLEAKLKKAIEQSNALAVQSIYDEADQTPGANMKKIKKKCQRWLNKKAGEDQKMQQANQPAAVRTAGAGGAAAAAAAALAAQRPTQLEMFCPVNIAPQVIGRGGQTINKLMKDSSAKIVIKPYPDRSGNDVVVTGTATAVNTAKRMLEDFYRSKGCDPTTLQPPLSAVTQRMESLHPGGGAVPARSAAGGVGRGAPPAQPAMTGRGFGGGAAAPAPAPVVVEDGAWGGELRQLLKVAGCEHHLEGFRRDQLDGEVLLMMERRDFARMGVTEAEQMRILNALKGAGGGAADDDDEDSDGLDPDHPDTCKICMDALVDILFLPCAHQCTCSRCGLGFTGMPCILCRRPVEKVQKVIKIRGNH